MEERRPTDGYASNSETHDESKLHLCIVVYTYIYICAYHRNSVNVLNVKLPEYVCAQSHEMQKLYKVDRYYYNNARELNYYNIVIVIIDVLLL